MNSFCSQFKDSQVGFVLSGNTKFPNIPSKNGLSKYEKFTNAACIPRAAAGWLIESLCSI